MNRLTGITHFGIRCSDFERSKKFYTETLGLEEVFSIEKENHPWLTYLRVSGQQFVELFCGEYDTRNMGLGYPASHVCFLTEDIQALARDLEAKGIVLYRGPSFLHRPQPLPFEPQKAACGSMCFYICDPDGNELEFMQFTEDSKQIK